MCNSVRLPRAHSKHAFSLIEVVAVIAVVGLLAAVALPFVSDMREGATESHLQSGVAQLNESVNIYRASGGHLAGLSDPQQVIDKMKSRRSPEAAARFAGFSGSMVDERLLVVPLTETEIRSSRLRAIWDPSTLRFETTRQHVPGIARFTFDSVKGAADYGAEIRDESAISFNLQDGWIWGYSDSDGTSPPEVHQVTLSTIQPYSFSDPSGPGSDFSGGSRTELWKPVFSVAGGSFPVSEFPLTLELINPNPANSSTTWYQIVGLTDWMPYGGPISIQPDYLVSAYAKTSSVLYSNSQSASEHYSDANLPPKGLPDLLIAHEDDQQDFNLLANDTDPEGKALRIQLVNSRFMAPEGVALSLGEGGSILVQEDGTVRFDPEGSYDHFDDGENVTELFTYGVQDPEGRGSTVLATLDIQGEDDAILNHHPTTTFLTGLGESFSFDALEGFSDPDTSDNPLSVTNVTAGYGTVNLEGSTIHYTAPASKEALETSVGDGFEEVFYGTGNYTLSVDGAGSPGKGAYTIGVEKPVGGTVASVFALVAGDYSTSESPGSTPVKVAGVPLELEFSQSSEAPEYLTGTSRYGDVTEALAGVLNGLPAGVSQLDVEELDFLEGASLFVVWNDPDAPTSTISIALGSRNTALGAGGSFRTGLIDKSFDSLMVEMGFGVGYSWTGSPASSDGKSNNGHGNNVDGVDSSNPGKSKKGQDTDPTVDDEKKGSSTEAATGSLAGGYGTDPSAYTGQYSFLTVNGNLASSSLGGEDDGTPNNGALWTVGGVGDSAWLNPSDELFDVTGLLQDGDLTINWMADSTTGHLYEWLNSVTMQGRGLEGLNPGTDVISFTVQNQDGDSVRMRREVTLDGITSPLQAPAITSSAPDFVAGSVENITVEVRDPNRRGSALDYRLAGGAWQAYSSAFSVTRATYPSGLTVEARARATSPAFTDSSIASSAIGLTPVDLQVPAIALSAANFRAGTVESLSVTLTNPNGAGSALDYRLAGGAWQAYSSIFSVTRASYPSGLTVEARARSTSPAYTDSGSASVTVGLTAVQLQVPAIALSAANFRAGTVESISVTLTNPNGAGSALDYRLAGGAWQAYSSTFSVTRASYPSGLTVEARARATSPAFTDSSIASSAIGIAAAQLKTPTIHTSAPNFVVTKVETVTIRLVNPNPTSSVLDYRLPGDTWRAYSSAFSVTRNSYPGGLTVEARARSTSLSYANSETATSTIGVKDKNAKKLSLTFSTLNSSAGYLNEAMIYVNGDGYYLGNSDMGPGTTVTVDLYLNATVANAFDLTIDTFMRSGSTIISSALHGLDTQNGSQFDFIGANDSFAGYSTNSAKIKDLSNNSNVHMIVGYEDLIVCGQTPDYDYNDFMFDIQAAQKFNFVFGGY